jgi:hypothetical protein
MGQSLSPIVFVVEIDQQPIAAFAVRSIREAIEVSREAWFREELKQLSSHGRPLWDAKAPIKARSARPDEIRAYAEGAPQTEVDLDEIEIVYLVEIDRKRPATPTVNPGAFPPARTR